MKLIIDNDHNLIDRILRFTASLSPSPNSLVFHSVSRFPNKDPVYNYRLGEGNHNLRFNNVSLTLTYTLSDQIVGNAVQAVKYHTLILLTKTYVEKDFFTNFLEKVHEYCKPSKEKTEVITYIFKTGYWQQLSKLPKRLPDTIHLPDKVLNETMDDVKNFLNNKKLYMEHGIPYKRNYLFEGIPGTGKTSLIFVLASHFNMNVAIINFGLSIDDATFMKSVSKLPEDTFLVLEDIDALFVERKTGDAHKSMVSFSGILNTLDGLARRDKQVTFLTTNYISKLDSALIRPGRIDKIITFSHATIDQVRKFYMKFFPKQSDRWDIFKKKCKSIKTTTALLQSFFFKHLNSDDIVSEIDDLKKMSQDKGVNTRNNLYL